MHVVNFMQKDSGRKAFEIDAYNFTLERFGLHLNAGWAGNPSIIAWDRQTTLNINYSIAALLDYFWVYEGEKSSIVGVIEVITNDGQLEWLANLNGS